MNLFDDNEINRQSPMEWSGHLGRLAAENSVTKSDFSNRLVALVNAMRQRNKQREAAESLRAAHFIMTD